ncbi:energy-coupled thiamine transporter ThiT [Mycoplasma sp. ATU-Cv-703]|uniref:energy-coupled thiamine transporter ThiT n=1 Tax=Mycoplasma sp. ATU-Cv-703 TaxID=2498595 RepID=UPI00137538F4
MLTLLLLAHTLAWLMPDLPSGLGSVFVLPELLTVGFSFFFGWKKTLLTGLIFYGALVWAAPAILISGIFWAKNAWAGLGVLTLDYWLPYLFLALSGSWTWKKTSVWFNLGWTFLMVGGLYCSHVVSGVVLWASYAWEGYSAWTYSLVANSFRSAVLLISSGASLPLCLRTINKNNLNQNRKQIYASY